MKKKILIIKHGSLGDIIFTLPVFCSITKHFSDYEIHLLTEKKYINFFNKSNYFNKIIEDNRSSNPVILYNLFIKIYKNKYKMIIDLQNSSRTSYYNFFFKLLTNSKISSSRKFSHFRYNIPIQGVESATDGLFNQIKLINVSKYPTPSYSWLDCEINLKDKKIVLMIPGVSLSGKYKQWSPNKFADLAKFFEEIKYTICIVGTNNDLESVNPIIKNCHNVINKINLSPPEVIYSIAKKSNLIITNDTGPGHIASLSGCNTIWIANDNKITKANIDSRSNNYKISKKNIKDITVQEVIKYIKEKKLL